jgi:plastocyanin
VRRLAIAAVALALGGCGGGDGSTSSSPGVEAADFRFAPARVRVTAGQVLEWRNRGTTDHAIKGPGFFSRAVPPGGRWMHRFDKPGTYSYFCTLHPDVMRAVVVVPPG